MTRLAYLLCAAAAIGLTGASPIHPILALSPAKNCECQFSQTWLDIVLAIETTQSMGDNGLSMVMSYLATALDDLNLNGKNINGNRANLAVITFGNNAQTVYKFGDLTSVFQIMAEDKIQPKDDSTSNVAGAITLATSLLEDGSKPEVAQLLILAMSSGNKYDASQVDKISGQFKENGRKIIIIDYVQEGQRPNTHHYSVASPGYLLQTSDGDDNVDKVQTTICDANCFCGAGQVKYHADFSSNGRDLPNGGCYYFSNAQATYKYADLACQKKGGIVAAPTDKAKDQFLATVAVKPSGIISNYFIGYNKDTGMWKFVDGTSSSYTNWASGEPQVNKPYAYYDQSVNKWKSAASTLSNYYICQYTPCSTTYRDCLNFKAAF